MGVVINSNGALPEGLMWTRIRVNKQKGKKGGGATIPVEVCMQLMKTHGSSLVASPVPRDTERAYMYVVCLKKVAATVTKAMNKQGHQLECEFCSDPPVTVIEACVKQCLTAGLNPDDWTIIAHRFVPNPFRAVDSATAARQGPLPAIGLTVHCTENKLHLELEVSKCSVPAFKLEDYMPVQSQRQLFESRGLIYGEELEAMRCFVLPNGTEAWIAHISRDIPKECPLKTWGNMRDYWAKMNHLQLPETPPAAYVSVVFPGHQANPPLTYPLYCVLSLALSVSPNHRYCQDVIKDFVSSLPTITVGDKNINFSYRPVFPVVSMQPASLYADNDMVTASHTDKPRQTLEQALPKGVVPAKASAIRIQIRPTMKPQIELGAVRRVPPSTSGPHPINTAAITTAPTNAQPSNPAPVKIALSVGFKPRPVHAAGPKSTTAPAAKTANTKNSSKTPAATTAAATRRSKKTAAKATTADGAPKPKAPRKPRPPKYPKQTPAQKPTPGGQPTQTVTPTLAPAQSESNHAPSPAPTPTLTPAPANANTNANANPTANANANTNADANANAQVEMIVESLNMVSENVNVHTVPGADAEEDEIAVAPGGSEQPADTLMGMEDDFDVAQPVLKRSNTEEPAKDKQPKKPRVVKEQDTSQVAVLAAEGKLDKASIDLLKAWLKEKGAKFKAKDKKAVYLELVQGMLAV